MRAKGPGSKQREYFDVTDAAKREAPTVTFNATSAAPATAAPAAKP